MDVIALFKDIEKSYELFKQKPGSSDAAFEDFLAKLNTEPLYQDLVQ